MKKVILLTGLILTLALNAHAAENMAFETIALSDTNAPLPQDAFQVIATETGELITNPGKVFTDGGNYEGMTLPYLLSNPTPIPYPRWAISKGWEGELNIAIEVLTDGSVGRHKVMASSGREILDQAAVEAVKSWKFQPASKDGQLIVTCVQIPVRFELRQS